MGCIIFCHVCFSCLLCLLLYILMVDVSSHSKSTNAHTHDHHHEHSHAINSIKEEDDDDGYDSYAYEYEDDDDDDGYDSPSNYHNHEHTTATTTTTGSSSRDFRVGLDGVDLAHAIRTNNPTISPRQDVLLELFDKGDKVHPGMWAVGYRKGRYKLVDGLLEDFSHCYESSGNMLNCSKTGNVYVDTVGYVSQLIFQWAEYVYGDASFDSVKGAMLLAHIQRINVEMQGSGMWVCGDRCIYVD